MKIIISHDVDHLYATDHVFKDMILEKLWVRSILQFCSGRIGVKTLWYRLTLIFHNRMHRVDELMEFDHQHSIPSVFFFGMDSMLGMSYSKEKAVPVIKRVMENGFDIGVHGVDYQNAVKIQKEHDAFAEISGLKSFGIRNHYVRFDNETFQKMDRAGYLFDSTWFNKIELEICAPYKEGNMWEFPLHIMDGYICTVGNTGKSLDDTKKAILLAEKMGMSYCTILFHDSQFDDRYDPQMKQWYIDVVSFCEEREYEFISYRDAIKELEDSQ